MMDEIRVSLPLSTLAELLALPEQCKKVAEDNKRLRLEMTALRGLYSELLQKVAELD